MVEIDEEEVDICEEYLPEWSDCSDFSEEESCFDDERATVIFADAFGWFIDRYSNEETGEEKFDAIVMDALDPDKFVSIVGSLYKSDEFVRSLFNGLSEEGVVSVARKRPRLKSSRATLTSTSTTYQFVMQSGQCDSLADPAEDSGPSQDEIHMVRWLAHCIEFACPFLLTKTSTKSSLHSRALAFNQATTTRKPTAITSHRGATC